MIFQTFAHLKESNYRLIYSIQLYQTVADLNFNDYMKLLFKITFSKVLDIKKNLKIFYLSNKQLVNFISYN